MTADVGWAVSDNSAIIVNTVSDTRRAAIVNWLVAGKNVMVYSETTDEQIDVMWNRYSRGLGVSVGRVKIQALA